MADIEHADEYTDLPAWCRPGAAIGLITWLAGSSKDTAQRARIARITKTRVVFTFMSNSGREVEDFVPRHADLNRAAMAGRGGARLLQLNDPAYRDTLAVQQARGLEYKIGKLFGLRAGSTGIHHRDERKPLKTRDDALDLLDEVAAAVADLRTRIAAEIEAEGA